MTNPTRVETNGFAALADVALTPHMTGRQFATFAKMLDAMGVEPYSLANDLRLASVPRETADDMRAIEEAARFLAEDVRATRKSHGHVVEGFGSALAHFVESGVLAYDAMLFARAADLLDHAAEVAECERVEAARREAAHLGNF